MEADARCSRSFTRLSASEQLASGISIVSRKHALSVCLDRQVSAAHSMYLNSFDHEKLVTDQFSLDQADRAYALMASGKCGKVAVVFE